MRFTPAERAALEALKKASAPLWINDFSSWPVVQRQARLGLVETAPGRNVPWVQLTAKGKAL
jgi:hypothetical protein